MKFIIISAALVSSASAAVVVDYAYNNPSAVNDSPTATSQQFRYDAFVTLGPGDSWDSLATLGGWSYVDLDPTKNQNRGWGHAATWFLLELTDPGEFSVSMDWLAPASGPLGPEGRPGFTIYSGESVHHNTDNLHTFSNNGNDLTALNSGWDKNTTPLAFAGTAVNLTGASVSDSFMLPAGRYTIVLGNAHDSTTAYVDRDFNFTFAAVPEPSSALLMTAGCLVLVGRRRR